MAILSVGTLGTPKTESVSRLEAKQVEFGTLGTPNSNPYAYENGDGNTHVHYMYKDKETAVPSVPTCDDIAVMEQTAPSITPGGDLRIPFNSPEKYHWWKGGDRLTLEQTRAEIETNDPSHQTGTVLPEPTQIAKFTAHPSHHID